MNDELIRLLEEIDGQLGLAVYRDEHGDRWKAEAKDLITRVRDAIFELKYG